MPKEGKDARAHSSKPATRSSSRKSRAEATITSENQSQDKNKTSNKKSRSENVSNVIEQPDLTSANVESVDIPSTSEVNDNSGPTWTDFNMLRRSVDEMKGLLKSITSRNASSVDSLNDNPMLDENATVSVDNQIHFGIGGPMEVPAVSLINNERNRAETNVQPTVAQNSDIPFVSQTSNVDGQNISNVSSVNEYLRSFMNSTNSGELFYNPPGKPLDLKVSEKTKQKIWSEQYIDIATLLDPQINTQVGLTILSDPGEPIKFGPSKSTKTINSLGQWCSAFEIFITIYCQKNPGAISPLLTYMNTIKSLSHKNGDYIGYDRDFRYMKQTMNLAWDSIHTGLWLECRDNGKYNKTVENRNRSKSNNDSFRPKNGNAKNGQSKIHPFGYCFRFHNYGKCGRASCKFKHTCYECNDEQHAFIKCPKNKSGNSNSSEQSKSN